MALSDRFSQNTIVTAVRRELMDANARWFSDTELNGYVADWQDALQDKFEFVWGTATATTTASATLTFATVAPDALRIDAVYWRGTSTSDPFQRLPGRSRNDLDLLSRTWRTDQAAAPKAVYQDDYRTASFWPAPTAAGVVLLEYPKLLTFAAGTSTMQIPAWTKYSAVNYAVMRAYKRVGPNQDLQRAARRRAKFERQLARYRLIWDAHFPDLAPTLRPATSYERNILDPVMPVGGSVALQIVRPAHHDEVPGGAVNGTNGTFTLTHSPDPAISLKLFIDGVLMTKDTHYTLSGTSIIFVTAFIPVTGQTLFANYRFIP